MKKVGRLMVSITASYKKKNKNGRRLTDKLKVVTLSPKETININSKPRTPEHEPHFKCCMY